MVFRIVVVNVVVEDGCLCGPGGECVWFMWNFLRRSSDSEPHKSDRVRAGVIELSREVKARKSHPEGTHGTCEGYEAS